MRRIMLDLETMGVTPGCVVLSIGAVEFDNEKIIKGFEVHIDTEDAVANGAHMDVSTVMWWLGQSKEAHNALLNSPTVSVYEACARLIDAFEWKDKQVWCKGAAFDFPIIKALFDQVGFSLPWKYSMEMDMRTVQGLVGRDIFKAQYQVNPDIAHSALADARAQALSMMRWFNDR